MKINTEKERGVKHVIAGLAVTLISICFLNLIEREKREEEEIIYFVI